MNQALKKQIAKSTANQIYEAYPFLWDRFGERGFEHTEKDNLHHLDHLETAYDLNDKQVFLDYTIWLEKVLTSRNVGADLIIDNFERLIGFIEAEAEQKEKEFMQQCLQEANDLLKGSNLKKGG
ncbi:hypothetical protein BN1080_01089 [Planococcus massiliensis]|uniref:Uncharacterized protein n=1 Tax=Planococcus massiliensis TaxID=1499687 RepID=A0A098EJW6_9BACL|nr:MULTISPECIES: hypothetical protein [Planococcus]MCJ1908425.1 hypothetical protein [Planococcus ruber]CEG22167.1 hypothetical protein BN1080_01089 [Planococcus massiliensis]